MPYPRDLPKEIRGLWKIQYEPREKILLRIGNKESIGLYKKLPYYKKMRIIDNMQSEGDFD